MSAFLTLDSVSLAAPDGRVLFEGLTLALGAERIGLVGRNGSGKSTLLHVIASGAEPARGSIRRAGSIGVLRQIADESLGVAEALGVAEGLVRLRRLEAGEGSADDAAEADWTLEARLQAALSDTGLPHMPLDRKLATLSGGERTRVALARLLIEAPDLLLLDEPTNNLDADGRAAVADLLLRWRGGAIVASHDRALLERVDRIVELSPIGVTVFGGGWTEFKAARDAARERAEVELDRAGSALRRTEREAQQAKERQDKRDKAGRAKRAKNDAPKILLDAQAERAENTAARGSKLADRLIGDSAEALEEARSRVEVLTPLSFQLPATGLPAGRDVLSFANVTMEQGGRRLFGPLSFDVRGPERIAIRGPNGSGKTTLLRLITGELSPVSGAVKRGLAPAFLDQHVSLLQPDASILDNIRRLNPQLSDNEAYAALARFAFRNEAALRIAGTLSGGERLRAGLACVFARAEPPQLLMLDEPTNHLDLSSIEELEAALSDFDGALIVVSHDDRFLQTIGAGREIRLGAPA